MSSLKANIWNNNELVSWPGLDAYFFPSLAVGQPSSNMDLSEIKIYLGMIITLFFGNEKVTNREFFDHLYVYFLF